MQHDNLNNIEILLISSAFRKCDINFAIIAYLDLLTCVSRITANLASKVKFIVTISGNNNT